MQEFPHTLKIVTLWLLAGTVLFLGFRYLEQRRYQTQFSNEGGVIQIQRGPDGHYHWPGHINGRRVDFLIDTGATSTAMSQALADELGLTSERQVRSHTAAGVVVGQVVRADVVLEGGVQVERLPITALAGLGRNPLLGMDVLGRLRWQQHDGVLILRPGAHP